MLRFPQDAGWFALRQQAFGEIEAFLEFCDAQLLRTKFSEPILNLATAHSSGVRSAVTR